MCVPHACSVCSLCMSYCCSSISSFVMLLPLLHLLLPFAKQDMMCKRTSGGKTAIGVLVAGATTFWECADWGPHFCANRWCLPFVKCMTCRWSAPASITLISCHVSSQAHLACLKASLSSMITALLVPLVHPANCALHGFPFPGRMRLSSAITQRARGPLTRAFAAFIMPDALTFLITCCGLLGHSVRHLPSQRRGSHRSDVLSLSL